MSIVYDDPLEYRAPGYLTVALFDEGDPLLALDAEEEENPVVKEQFMEMSKPTFLIIEPEYEEHCENKDPQIIEKYRYYCDEIRLRIRLNKALARHHTYNFNTLIALIHEYGGINVNLANGAFKGFIDFRYL